MVRTVIGPEVGTITRHSVEVRVLEGDLSDRRFAYVPGVEVPFGRAAEELRVSHTAVSRRHGVLYVGPHFVVITRLLGTGPLWIDRIGDTVGPALLDVGESAVMDRGTAIIRARLGAPPELVEGLDELLGSPILRIDVITPVRPDGRAEEPTDHGPTREAEMSLRSKKTHPVLVALCERLVGYEQSGAPLELPSNTQIAARLSAAGRVPVTPETVRNQLSKWREWLGISPTESSRCRCALAIAAVQSGLVVREDLDALE